MKTIRLSKPLPVLLFSVKRFVAMNVLSDKKLSQPDAMHDKQSEPDYRQLRIDKVGVRGLRFPIQIRDKAHTLQNTIATIGMFVDLPHEFKGTHMSRFI
jgi:GTP cyclohydrolase I